jgi:hypothetical protein
VKVQNLSTYLPEEIGGSTHWKSHIYIQEITHVTDEPTFRVFQKISGDVNFTLSGDVEVLKVPCFGVGSNTPYLTSGFKFSASSTGFWI